MARVNPRSKSSGPNLDIKALGASSPPVASKSHKSGGFGGNSAKNHPYVGSGNPTGVVKVVNQPSSASRSVKSSGVAVPSVTSSADAMISQAIALSQANSAFNAREAQKNRDWQERMSNTAHQREVADLLAAGLNPVLSVTGGSGASTPSGAVASADSSGVSAMSSILGSVLSSNATLAAAALASSASRYAAELNNPLSYILYGASGSGKQLVNKIASGLDMLISKL